MIYIQHSNPRINIPTSSDFDDLSDAFEDAFELNTEDAILRISHLNISISYKYDVAYLMEDMLQPLEELINSDELSVAVTFASNSLPYTLEMHRRSDLIDVYLKERMDPNANSLDLTICEENVEWTSFLCEWISFFEFSLKLLDLNGYNLKGYYIYNSVNRLARKIQLSGCKGYLYK